MYAPNLAGGAASRYQGSRWQKDGRARLVEKQGVRTWAPVVRHHRGILSAASLAYDHLVRGIVRRRRLSGSNGRHGRTQTFDHSNYTEKVSCVRLQRLIGPLGHGGRQSCVLGDD